MGWITGTLAGWGMEILKDASTPLLKQLLEFCVAQKTAAIANTEGMMGGKADDYLWTAITMIVEMLVRMSEAGDAQKALDGES
jgi:hypothetical protein